MGNLISEKQIIDKRLEKFLCTIRNICSSPSSFKKKVDVQISHIAWRAAETGSVVRNAMKSERIASSLYLDI